MDCLEVMVPCCLILKEEVAAAIKMRKAAGSEWMTTICRSDDLTVPPLVGCCLWNHLIY